MDRKQDGIIHVCLLVMLQWISVSVVILNLVALSMSQQYPQLEGRLVSSQAGPQDVLLVALGIVSFLAASLPLTLHLYIYCRSHGTRSFSPSKMVLITEMSVGIVMVALWAASSSIVLTHFHVSSSCRLDVMSDISVCKMLDTAITLGLVAIAGWVVMLITASISITRLPVIPSFVLESNPYHTIGYPLELSASRSTAPPSYTHDIQTPPPAFSTKKPSSSSYMTEKTCDNTDDDYDYYHGDTKYPIYSVDSLPAIYVGSNSTLDLTF